MQEKRYRGFDSNEDKDSKFSTMKERNKAQPEYIQEENVPSRETDSKRANNRQEQHFFQNQAERK